MKLPQPLQLLGGELKVLHTACKAHGQSSKKRVNPYAAIFLFHCSLDLSS